MGSGCEETRVDEGGRTVRQRQAVVSWREEDEEGQTDRHTAVEP